MKEEEHNTLEPIHPIKETPYGALVIHNDVLCTPTSLCTWSGVKPEVYCKLPPHTLNPVCQQVNKGIGLLGCYEEATCGGMSPISKTNQILAQNPHYQTIIRTAEQRLKRGITKKRDFTTLALFSVLVFLSFMVLLLFGRHGYKMYKKRRLFSKKVPFITRNRMHSTSHKISSDAGKIVKLSSR